MGDGGEGADIDGQSRWIDDSLFPAPAEGITRSLDYLHNATNWGIVVVSGSLALVLGQDEFPDETSLLAFLVIFIFGTHFLTRSAKGYTNVIRFSFLERSIAQNRLQLPGAPSHADLRHLIDLYFFRWALPLSRADVFIKVLFKLGFGYLLGITAVLAAYTAIRIPFTPQVLLAVLFAAALAAAEITIFTRSPYMRSPHPSEKARILK
jgi:hypothetical protein